MIATSFVRIFPPTVHTIASDGPWYNFWEAFETIIANLMVSITSFKSIYGEINQSNSSKFSPGNKPSFTSRMSSHMSRLLLRTSESNASTVQTFEELPPATERIHDDRYLAWKTPRYYSPDAEKGLGHHASVSSQIRAQEQIAVEVPRRSGSELTSVSSNAFQSPMSTMIPHPSPMHRWHEK